jgi:hypothetical protein
VESVPEFHLDGHHQTTASLTFVALSVSVVAAAVMASAVALREPSLVTAASSLGMVGCALALMALMARPLRRSLAGWRIVEGRVHTGLTSFALAEVTLAEIVEHYPLFSTRPAFRLVLVCGGVRYTSARQRERAACDRLAALLAEGLVPVEVRVPPVRMLAPSLR